MEQVTFRQARSWIAVSLLALLTLPAVIFLHLGKGDFEGGWSSNALFYALWDPLVAWGVILGLLWATRTYWSQATRLTTWLARSAYGAYIVHPPIVVGVSLAATAWMLDPIWKFFVVGSVACIGSFFAAYLLVAIPGVRRVV